MPAGGASMTRSIRRHSSLGGARSRVSPQSTTPKNAKCVITSVSSVGPTCGAISTATYHRRAAEGSEGIRSDPGGHRRPESVDLLFGCRQALFCEGDQFGHGGGHLGEAELGGDEARFQTYPRDAMGEPRLGVVPAFPGRPLVVTAAA